MHNAGVPAGGVESCSGIDRLAEVQGLFLRSSILLFSMCLVAEGREQVITVASYTAGHRSDSF